MTEIETRQEKVRALLGHVTRNVNEYVYDNGAIEKWKMVDPERLEDFWRLHDWFDHSCKLFIEDKIPWDRDITTQIEVIQTDPDSTPVSVPIKRYDFGPSVMQAARDLFIFMVLP